MKIILPKLSATMEEGTIVQWLKKAGDAIREGDILYEVETDKTTMEVESSVTGVLTQILVPAGKVIATGTEICEIAQDSSKSEQAPAQQVSAQQAPVQQAPAQQAASDPVPAVPVVPATPPSLYSASASSSASSIPSPTLPAALAVNRVVVVQDIVKIAQPEPTRLRISPSARRLARTWNIDTRYIQGSGPMGRIRNRDIEAVVTSSASTPSAKPIAIPSIAPVVHDLVSSDISKMRMTLAKEMLRSTQTIPAFWVEKWVNADLVLKWKELLKQTKGQAFAQVSITDFILHAMGLALLEMPSVNRRWVVNQQGVASIVQVSGSHVGLAVSVDNGILSPILANVGELLLSHLIQVRQEAVAMTRNYKPYGLSEPAAITLSNLGHTGIDRFQAIVKPDETMILAVGGIQEKVIAVNGQYVIQQGFNLVLTADHRVLDGIDAAKFLAKIAEILESGAWKIA